MTSIPPGEASRPLVVAVTIVVALAPAGLAGAAVGTEEAPADRAAAGTSPLAPGGVTASLVDHLLEASEHGQTPAQRALDVADAALGHRLETGADAMSTGLRTGLVTQRANLEHARGALATMDGARGDGFERSVRLAQASLLDAMPALDIHPTRELQADHGTPSRALEALAAHHGVALADTTSRSAAALDTLEPPVRDALTELLDRFLDLSVAAAGLADAMPAAPDQPRSVAQVLQVLEQHPTTAEQHEALLGTDGQPPAEPFAVSDELADVMLARVGVLDAALELREALAGDQPRRGPVVDEPGLIRIDLTGEATRYEEDYRFVVEAGGANVYHNNAGGSNLEDGACMPDPVDDAARVAALVDLGTEDKRFGARDDPYQCGVNGGGFGGVWGHAPVGVGMLVTAGGDNTYTAGAFGGANGGGFGLGGVGIGLLVDGGGENTFEAYYLGANGGGATGFFSEIGVGVGLLVSGGGDDRLISDGYGSNGGAHSTDVGLATGRAILPGGNNTLSSGYFGSNGGAYARSAATAHGGLILGAGDDDVFGEGVASNGGAHGSFGESLLATGFLVDAGGTNTFTGSHGLNGVARGDQPSTGLLVAAGEEDDTYHVTGGRQANGGAWGHDSHGLLVDAGGDDAYIVGGGTGANGGAKAPGAAGLLYDLAGDDTYIAETGGVNGGVVAQEGCHPVATLCLPTPPIGLLLDGGGMDYYEDGEGGTGWDKTVVPKGAIGAQIDVGGPA